MSVTYLAAEILDGLPDGSLVCTAGGIVFQKHDGYFKEGEHGWERPGREWVEHTWALMESVHHPIEIINWTPPE